MKKKKVISSALAMSFLFGAMAKPSLASNINTNSGFYKSSRTRQAYINLTNDQRKELDSMNTNNNGWLTIKEVKNYGKYSLPIVKGQNYLYPFMDDRNNNGMVGENESQSSSQSNDSQNKSIDLGEDLQEENEKNPANKDDLVNQIPEVLEGAEGNTLSVEKLKKLEKSIKDAKETIGGAEILMHNMPKFAKEHGNEINKLIERQNKLIEKANKILLVNGIEI